MNFEFSEEQNMLRDQARNFLDSKCSLKVVRTILDGEDSFATDVWAEMKQLGWMGTSIPEEYGGLGMTDLELCVIAEELGRSLAPTPFSSSVYLFAETLLSAGSEDQKKNTLPSIASGDAIGTLAISESASVPTAIEVTARDGKLSGIKLPVTDGDIADKAIVLAKDDDGMSLYLTDLTDSTVTRQTLKSIDPTRSQVRVEFSSTPAERLGGAGQGRELLDKVYNSAAVLFAFEQVGGAQAALDQARDYALERYAFGRPIGSFQAIKHKLADMYVATELARSNSYYGAWALSNDAPELPVAAATARVSATEAFELCSKENIQTHGGMGFTWEFDCHMFYRRSKLLAVNLGSLTRWKDRLVTNIEQTNL